MEELYGFTEESLDTLDRDDLIISITKSFGVDIERVEAILKKSLDINALVKLARCAIELANEHVIRAESNKKRKDEGNNQAGQSKKGKTNEPSVTSLVGHQFGSEVGECHFSE